jgi:hypothetical protein
MLVSLARLLLDQGRAVEAQALYRQASGMMASAGAGRLAGEDMRFDLRVLDIRIRHALGELTSAQVRAALHAQAPKTVAPLQQAAVQYELWRLAHDDEVARVKAATLYREQYHETGAEDCRTRFRELTGETLPDPEPLPDVSDLIPLEPGDQAGLDLEAVLADLEILLA